jgi:hypothetical protein
MPAPLRDSASRRGAWSPVSSQFAPARIAFILPFWKSWYGSEPSVAAVGPFARSFSGLMPGGIERKGTRSSCRWIDLVAQSLEVVWPYPWGSSSRLPDAVACGTTCPKASSFQPTGTRLLSASIRKLIRTRRSGMECIKGTVLTPTPWAAAAAVAPSRNSARQPPAPVRSVCRRPIDMECRELLEPHQINNAHECSALIRSQA